MMEYDQNSNESILIMEKRIPLRLFKINVKEERVAEIIQILGENNISDYWQTCGCESNSIFKIIMHLESTEKLLNIIETLYGHLPEFRATLVTLEATIPNVQKIDVKIEEAKAASSRRH